jgi:DNA-binding NarL/FixJ family response regulator
MASKRKRVLIVEDDPCAAKGLRRLLEHYECDVTDAGTVADGIKGLEAGPEVVFLDLLLPDGEGTRVLERVRMTRAACRVIVVSGVSEPGMLWRAKALRPDAMLPKPVDFMRVLELLRPAA